MSRASKCRRVCMEPKYRQFQPDAAAVGTVEVTVVELEALRLCDLEGLEQDEAAARMEISRGTLQRILYAARHAVADALVNGKTLVIQGGNYRLASGHCQCGASCAGCRFQQQKKEM